jgi:hypothetical protein
MIWDPQEKFKAHPQEQRGNGDQMGRIRKTRPLTVGCQPHFQESVLGLAGPEARGMVRTLAENCFPLWASVYSPIIKESNCVLRFFLALSFHRFWTRAQNDLRGSPLLAGVEPKPSMGPSANAWLRPSLLSHPSSCFANGGGQICRLWP